MSSIERPTLLDTVFTTYSNVYQSRHRYTCTRKLLQGGLLTSASLIGVFACAGEGLGLVGDIFCKTGQTIIRGSQYVVHQNFLAGLHRDLSGRPSLSKRIEAIVGQALGILISVLGTFLLPIIRDDWCLQQHESLGNYHKKSRIEPESSEVSTTPSVQPSPISSTPPESSEISPGERRGLSFGDIGDKETSSPTTSTSKALPRPNFENQRRTNQSSPAAFTPPSAATPKGAPPPPPSAEGLNAAQKKPHANTETPSPVSAPPRVPTSKSGTRRVTSVALQNGILLLKPVKNPPPIDRKATTRSVSGKELKSLVDQLAQEMAKRRERVANSEDEKLPFEIKEAGVYDVDGQMLLLNLKTHLDPLQVEFPPLPTVNFKIDTLEHYLTMCSDKDIQVGDKFVFHENTPQYFSVEITEAFGEQVLRVIINAPTVVLEETNKS